MAGSGDNGLQILPHRARRPRARERPPGPAGAGERSGRLFRRALQLLLGHTELVVVTTPNESSAHRIFGVMNARGLELSPTDIFKSSIIGSLGVADVRTQLEEISDSHQLIHPN